MEASERIGLYPRLAEVVYHIRAADYVDANGRIARSIDYLHFSRLAGGKVLSLLRPDLKAAALATLADVPAARVQVVYGSRLARIWSDRGGAYALVENGQELSADVLIGADWATSHSSLVSTSPASSERLTGSKRRACWCGNKAPAASVK